MSRGISNPVPSTYDTIGCPGVHVDAGASCETVTVCPATVRLAVRGLVDVLAVAEKATAPLPVPALPLVIVSQLLLLAAVQVQLVPAVTLTDPVLAVAARVTRLADSV
jgi:hypothetical protein